MRRKKRHQQNLSSSQNLIEKFEKFHNSPIYSLTEKIKSEFEFINSNAEQIRLNNSVKEFDALIERLPKSFDDRFNFDSNIIDTVSNEWNRNNQILTHPIIPNYESKWGHESLVIPVFNRDKSKDITKALSIEIIKFQGQDDLNEIDLLDYPFLFHELGHNLLFHNDTHFIESFTTRLEGILKKLQVRAIADQGTARDKAIKQIEEIRNKWTPTPNHYNWAHELAIDIIAFVGLVDRHIFLLFKKKIEDGRENIFYITQSHPPYDIRLETLIAVSSKFNMKKSSERLESFWQRKNNEQSREKNSKNNEYIALTNPEIVQACIESIIETCELYDLPRCDINRLNEIREKIAKNQQLETGTELIVGAWIFNLENSEDKYDVWEQKTIQSFI